MLAEHSKCNSEYKNDKLYVSLSGEIDHHSAVLVREYVDRQMMKYRPKALVLNLSGVSFMDSSGLGLVLGRCALGEEIGTHLCICGANARIMKILSMAGVDRIKNITIDKKGDR